MSRVEYTDADRDERGRLRAPGFAALLAETMAATGAAPAPEEKAPPRRPIGRLEIAGIVAGLVVATALIVLVNRVVPAQDAPRPTAAPAQAPPTVAAPVVIPVVTPLPTEAPPTPEPPTQTPAVVVVEVPAPPCYSVTQDVYDGSRPLGTVTGTSCESQEAAQAAADQLAKHMRVTGPGALGKGAQLVNSSFRKTVLATSPITPPREPSIDLMPLIRP